MIGFCIGVITGVLLMSMLGISKRADTIAEKQHRCRDCKWYKDMFCTHEQGECCWERKGAEEG